jgi:hypothetical protein
VSDPKTFCWIGDDGGWKVGRIAWPGPGMCLLMRLYHTGDLLLVDQGLLKPYPQSPIQEPTK